MKVTNYNIVQASALSRQFLVSLSFFVMALFIASPVQAVCNQPPVPGPAQTVTWSTANSPFQLCSDLTIPATGTVIVEPGVTVALQAHTITVDGTFNVQGSSTGHVAFSDTTVFPARRDPRRWYNHHDLRRLYGAASLRAGQHDSYRLHLYRPQWAYLYARYFVSKSAAGRTADPLHIH